ncbi:MAG: GDSL-type esterase/lipase family protein, partial [Armatimonadota bacterium]|nr:GDSL-type esterase/lipase family protein [Armatimonadota bacterium]
MWKGITKWARRRLLLALAACCAVAHARVQAAPPSNTPPQKGAESVAARLRRGETITLAVLGDSLAAGFELANPARDSYPALLATLLQRRFPAARVRLVNAGVPGDTAAGGLARLERDVLAQHPDIMLVQFGGNDWARQRDPNAVRADLEEVVRRARGNGTEVVVVGTPPIVASSPNTPMVLAAKEAAAATAAPVADFDGAIRRYGTGPRGPFPFGRHPPVYLHGVMAKAAYEALAPALGPSLSAAIQPGMWEVARAPRVPVRVTIQAPGSGPILLTLEQEETHQELRVEASATGKATATFLIPAPASSPGTPPQRLLLTARRGDAWGCDVRSVSAAPVVAADGAWNKLDPAGVVLGREQWRGAEDLSAAFRVVREANCFRVTCKVRDDRVWSNPFFSALHESDCVELFLDLRTPAAQARPYWEEGVACYLISPGGAGDRSVRWQSLEPLPADRVAPTPTGRRVEGGYEVEVSLPFSLIHRYGSVGQKSIGFDIAVDDADDSWGRQSQLVWAGG